MKRRTKSFPALVEAILLIGPTGSGKTPFGRHLEREGIGSRRCHHFDFGSELRTIAGSQDPPQGFTDEEHAFIRDVLEKGVLLQNEHFQLAEKIVLNFLRSRGFHYRDVLVLNGLPRHRDQAEDMSAVVDVKHVVVLECAVGNVYGRIAGNSGGDRTDRNDDSIEMIRKKLEIFRSHTAPLIDYYERKGIHAIRVRVDAASSPLDVYSEVSARFPA